MKGHCLYPLFVIFAAVFPCLTALSQQEFIQSANIDASIFPDEILTESVVLDNGAGIFENAASLVYTEGRIRNETDQPSRASSIQYDPETGEYLIYSNGNDVWDNEDATAYLWTTRPRSHRMTVRVRWIQNGGNDWAKGGIMCRTDPANNSSPHFFMEFRGAEDGTEVGHRNWELAPTTQTLYQNADHEYSVFLGADAHEPVWLRVTRIWPSNQLIFEDADQFLYEDEGIWDAPENNFAAFYLPEEMNWGLWGFDHSGTDVSFPDAPLIDNVLLEPIIGGNRIFDESHFAAGSPMSVTILLDNPGDPMDAAVTEIAPEGWTVSGVSDGGAASGNTITWSLSGVSDAKEVSYTVTPGADAVSGEFAGDVNGIMTAGPRLVGLAPENIGALGVFDGVSNIGGVAGEAAFADDKYTIATDGAIGGVEDGFNFVWKRVSGDFSIQGYFDTMGSDASRCGLMIRDSLAANSSFMFINLNPAWQVRMQTRDVAGNEAYQQRAAAWYEGTPQRNGTEFPGDSVNGVLKMERINGQVILSFGDLLQTDESLMTVHGAGIIVGSDPVYIGFASSSGSDSPDGEVEISEVEVIGEDTAVSDWSIF